VPIDPDRTRAAAQHLLEAFARGDGFEPLPAACAPRDSDEAYAIQSLLQSMRAPTLGPIAGWKIAGAARARRVTLDSDAPILAGLHASRILPGPATLRAADYVHLELHCEIVLELGVAVPPGAAPADGMQAARFVRAAMPAFEVLDDRGLRLPPPPALLRDVIAANAGTAGLIVGPGVVGGHRLALADLRTVLRIRNLFAGEATARATVGDPLEALARLIRALAARGVPLPAGTLVSTGSIGPPRYLIAGEDAALRIDGLGEVAVSVV
jgi:2-keto-4-pentenoate hydratase